MKISIHNTAELNAAIREVAGTAYRHTHTAKQAEEDALELLEKLKRHLPVRCYVGSVLRLSSRPTLPKAYGSGRRVIHTVIDVEIFHNGLFVTGIYRREEPSTSFQQPKATAILPEPIKEHLKRELYLKTVRI